MRNMILAALVVLVLGIGACKKCSDPNNPTCRNYDPCYGQTQVSAMFVFEQNNSYSSGIYLIKLVRNGHITISKITLYH